MVRAVAEATTVCPELKASSGRTLATMTPRRRPETGDFSGVLVCEARYPVVAVTASVMEQDRRKILAAGFDAFVSKPVNIRELLELLSTLVTRDEA